MNQDFPDNFHFLCLYSATVRNPQANIGTLRYIERAEKSSAEMKVKCMLSGAFRDPKHFRRILKSSELTILALP